MLTPRRVPLLTPEISRSFGAFRIVNKEKYVMLNEKGLIFCTFCVIISGKAAGWCVKRLEGTFPDIPGERSSMPYSDKTIPPALRATSLFKGGLFPRIMSPLKRGMSALADRGIHTTAAKSPERTDPYEFYGTRKKNAAPSVPMRTSPLRRSISRQSWRQADWRPPARTTSPSASWSYSPRRVWRRWRRRCTTPTPIQQRQSS